jgi:uncharacterized protein (DUF342 family)
MTPDNEPKREGQSPEEIRPPSNEEVEKLLKQIDDQLSTIETEEILKSYTPEELEERGLIGDKATGIGDPLELEAARCGYEFASGVDWCAKEGCKIFDISIDDIKQHAEIEPGKLIAVANSCGAEKQTSGNKEPYFDDSYRASSNVSIETRPEGTAFSSTVKGRVILLDKKVYVIASDRDASVSVRISTDHMSAFMDFYPPQGNGKKVTVDKVVSDLKKEGIISGLKRDNVANAVETLKTTGSPLINVPVAEGRKPRDGADARTDILFPKETTYEDFKVLPDGRIDYRKKANIQTVHKGDVLARIGEPQKGEDGLDVFGTILPCKTGSAETLCAGEGVGASDDGKMFSAERDGMPTLNGNILNVFQQYVVKEDIGYNTGNIEFDGNVLVEGCVRPGFEIKATGDIVVLRDVEAAIIIAGRDVKVCGGLIGGATGIVNCGRDLFVHHLQNANAEVQGDVHIACSSINSIISCNGRLFAKTDKGAIVGGTVNALGGVEAKILGSKSGAKTRIVIGSDFLVQKTIEELDKVLFFYQMSLTKFENTLKPLINSLHQGLRLNKDQRQRFIPIIAKRRKLKKQLAAVKQKHVALENKIHVNGCPTVRVHDVLYPDVVITIKNRTKCFTEPLLCTVIRADSNNGDLVVGRFYDSGDSEKIMEIWQRIEKIIRLMNLDEFKTKGAISLKAGIPIPLINSRPSGSPAQIEKLKAAGQEVLGEIFNGF